MKSTYKRLGDYIRLVNERNKNLQCSNLIGLSIEKKFIPSIANIIGTDMTTYRIIRNNQFAYCPITSRNGDKITIALYQQNNDAIISQAYLVFEIIDTEKLLPEYLMMWFRRPEFDRYARYMSHGSAREGFNWEELENTTLPIPSLEKQQAIVNEYNVLQNRISLNQKMNQKLEETAQAIYKQWFVDFEFPDENGNPYKSSGGEMVESALGEIPKGWEVVSISKFCKEMKSGGTPSRDNKDFWKSRDIAWLKTGEINNNVVISAEEYISLEGLKGSSAKLLPINTVLMAMYGVTAGQIGFLKFETTTNQACCAMICKNINHASYLFFYLLANQKYISGLSNGGAQPNLSKALIENLLLIKPSDKVLNNNFLTKIIDCREKLTKDDFYITQMKALLLSKLATLIHN